MSSMPNPAFLTPTEFRHTGLISLPPPEAAFVFSPFTVANRWAAEVFSPFTGANRWAAGVFLPFTGGHPAGGVFLRQIKGSIRRAGARPSAPTFGVGMIGNV